MCAGAVQVGSGSRLNIRRNALHMRVAACAASHAPTAMRSRQRPLSLKNHSERKASRVVRRNTQMRASAVHMLSLNSLQHACAAAMSEAKACRGI